MRNLRALYCLQSLSYPQRLSTLNLNRWKQPCGVRKSNNCFLASLLEGKGDRLVSVKAENRYIARNILDKFTRSSQRMFASVIFTGIF